ncbi:MAG: tRNA (adenosine(37)-N6)-threonylcarbamoyltransferase complex dimerization subunit type 1 TsaB [Betaproteobacteria bacterium]|nr:tRNA (adenosine(37)-N6)-threonylcarbamoyltransferase complex dimerization subunit type 1 TsaB [Betaproteobacteria bacterium]
MNLLAIETSTEYCSLAVASGDSVWARHELAGQRHAETILQAIRELLTSAGLAIADIEGIAYGAGPGSFTGLRVACGVAQGLAMAGDIGVVGIVSLLAVAEQSGARRAICCIDARMGEVYHAAYRRNADDSWTELIPPRVCRPDAVPPVHDADSEGSWSGCGSGFLAYRDILELRYAGQLVSIVPDALPTASAMLRLAKPRFDAGAAREPGSAIPVYIRDRVALKTSERA